MAFWNKDKAEPGVPKKKKGWKNIIRNWQVNIPGIANAIDQALLVRPDADIRTKKARMVSLCRAEATKDSFVRGFIL